MKTVKTTLRSITAIHWTWSIELFTVQFHDGERERFTPSQLQDLVGNHNYQILNRTAGQLDGHWHQVSEPIFIVDY